MDRKYVIYSRKSKYTGKGESVENQIEMCKRYIAINFGDEAAEQALVYEDEGFSGGNLDRPQFKQMMKDSHEFMFKAIVVYRLDRISRNIGDFAGLIQELGDRNIGFISIKEQFDTSSPMGRAMMYIASVFSQLERETIAERIRDNMRELAKTGRWLGGNTPMGYRSENVRKINIDGKTKSAFKLTQIPEEIEIIEKIYRKFQETGSLTQVDRFLLEGRYKTRRGKNFSRFSIKSILKNPVYAVADFETYEYLSSSGAEIYAVKKDFNGSRGVMAYNRTLQRPGKANEQLPIEHWIIALGSHQGCIEGKNWVQVQKMLKLNENKNFRRSRINEALLSGLLYCGNCGAHMRPKLSNRYNDRGERIYDYRCETKDRSKGNICSIENINGNILDQRIIDEIGSISINWTRFLNELKKSEPIFMSELDAYRNEISCLMEQLDVNEADINALIKALPRYINTNLENDIIRQIDILHEKEDDIQTRLEKLNTLNAGYIDQNLQTDQLIDMIKKTGRNIENLSTEQKRNALKLLIKKVIWDGENVNIYFHQEFKDKSSPYNFRIS